MAWSGPKDTSKNLWRIVRSIYRMFRRGIIRAVDLHLLLQRGKIAGKALGDLLASHHHYHTNSGGTSYPSAFSCRSMDVNTAFYSPREIQFSCSNTPSHPFLYSTKRRNRRRHRDYYYNYKVAAIAKAFEILNSEVLETDVAVASPSPESEWSYGKSPVVVRQLRVTDSPFPTREEEEGEVDGRIDSEAEEFIRRFYEQLRLQQCVSTAGAWGHRREAVVGRA